MYPCQTHRQIVSSIANMIQATRGPAQFYNHLQKLAEGKGDGDGKEWCGLQMRGQVNGRDVGVYDVLRKIMQNRQDHDYISQQLSKYSIILAENIILSHILNEEHGLKQIYLTISSILILIHHQISESALNLDQHTHTNYSELTQTEKLQYHALLSSLEQSIGIYQRQVQAYKQASQNHSSNSQSHPSSQSQSQCPSNSIKGSNKARSLLTQKLKQAQLDELQGQLFVNRIMLQNKTHNKQNLRTMQYSTNQKQFNYSSGNNNQRLILSENQIDNSANVMRSGAMRRKMSERSLISEMQFQGQQRKRQKRDKANSKLGCSECNIY